MENYGFYLFQNRIAGVKSCFIAQEAYNAGIVTFKPFIKMLIVVKKLKHNLKNN